MNKRPKSVEVFAQSCRYMPGGVNSPVRCFPGLGIAPLVVERGKGGRIWDVDGYSYIDFCCSWGAAILGHAPLPVILATLDQIEKGSSFGTCTPYESEIAQWITRHIPSIEKIRFVSSGTEAVMSAVRVARGYTGKPAIVKFEGNYHGHSDGLLVKGGSGLTALGQEASSLGVPREILQHTLSLPFNEVEACRSLLRLRDDIAVVVVEPIAGNMGVIPATEEFLHMLREETKKAGALLLFDEVITGFRVGLQGAQGLYEICPDLTCFGKIIGGGFPAAAFGGKREILDVLAPLGGVYQAGTLSGNSVAMRAGLAVLEEVGKPGFYEELEKKGDLFARPIQEYIQKERIDAVLQRVGSMFTLFLGTSAVTKKPHLDEALYKELFLYLFERGIYFPPCAYEACFLSSAHTEEELLYTQDAILSFFQEKSSLRRR